MVTVAKAARQALTDATFRWPNRRKESDGLLGDASHQARKSDHNDGNAVDITAAGAANPADGHTPLGAELAAMAINDPRVTYVIWNHQIYNRARADEGWRPYSGANPHDHHVHISLKPETRDDARNWEWHQEAAADTVPDTDRELTDIKVDAKVLVMMVLGAGGTYKLLSWIFGAIMLAAVLCGCEAFQQADRLLTQSVKAISEAEPKLQACYAEELDECKADPACELVVENAWSAVIHAMDEVREVWCEVMPAASGCEKVIPR